MQAVSLPKQGAGLIFQRGSSSTYEGLCEELVPEEALVSSGPLRLAIVARVLQGGPALLRQGDIGTIGVEELLPKDSWVRRILYQLYQPG